MVVEASVTTTVEKPAKRTRVNKRKRVSRACNYCRIRKHRCDGTHPTCSRCSAIHQPCNYGSDDKKRGLPTGYVHALELLWSLIFTIVPNSTSMVKSLMPDIRFSLDSRSRLIMESRFVKDPETLKQVWEDSGVPEQLGQLLSEIQESTIAGESLATADKTKSENLHVTPQLSFEAIRSASADVSMANSDSMRSHSTDTPTQSFPRAVQAPSQKHPASTTIFTQHVKHLLDAYFARTHLWLPIVQKYKMLELLYTPSRNAQSERGNMATLWAVLALSSLQESRDASSPVDHRASLPTPEQLYAKARQEIPNEEAVLPGHAQAFLILSLFKLEKGDVAACWYLIGQAVRICLNLDASSLSEKASSPEGGDDYHQRRLLLSCFVLDTIVSCQLRKPPHLRTEDVNFPPMLVETGPDEWESQAVSVGKSDNMSLKYQPSRAISIFNQYVGVVRILNDAMLDPTTSDRLCMKYLLALRHWHEHLPQHCLLSAPPDQDQLESVQSSSPQLINLHLAYKSTALFLKAQNSLLSEKGLVNTQSVTVTGPSIECLIKSFQKDFGATSMPAIFTSYKVIGNRDVASFNDAVSALDSRSVKPDFIGDLQLSIMKGESFPACLPTPADSLEHETTDASYLAWYSAPAPSCPTEGLTTKINTPMPEITYEQHTETWRQIFGSVELSEAGITDQKYQGDLDYLNGMDW
ncbi:uncharacterized protein FTOL_11744 [Fusarium torulosum]|uniref:Zn(2)-C6 fungal-type domain-containing protein n=1 Tax=Fusarium torulosum TaxID=33205 RepID=A0AAE8SNQ8_9HYPO|nr:uncharacterized protein FTOL_11744 [Fusarium torulosum]